MAAVFKIFLVFSFETAMCFFIYGWKAAEQVYSRRNSLCNCCMEIIPKEEALKEIVEIVGVEGLQEHDRLVIRVV